MPLQTFPLIFTKMTLATANYCGRGLFFIGWEMPCCVLLPMPSPISAGRLVIISDFLPLRSRVAERTITNLDVRKEDAAMNNWRGSDPYIGVTLLQQAVLLPRLNFAPSASVTVIATASGGRLACIDRPAYLPVYAFASIPWNPPLLSAPAGTRL